MLSLGLLSWQHGMRPGTDAKVVGSSVFLFIFAAISLAVWAKLPSVDPKIPETPVAQAKPQAQQPVMFNRPRTLKDPDDVSILPTKPKGNSRASLRGTQNELASGGVAGNDTTAQALVAERNSSVTHGNTVPDLTPADIRGPHFTVGSTKDEVLAVQGPPTKAGDHEWAYGLSKIEFRNDRVISWKISQFNPLHAKLAPSATASDSSDFFTIGSTKDEVLAVQGTPTTFGDREWAYGLSKVKFKNDRVISWKASEFNPLKARKLD